MIIPYSIPAWLKVKQNAKKHGLDISFSVDPTTGKHSGTFFYKGKSYQFKLEVYGKNMVLSMKVFNRELFNAWALSLEESYRVLYQSQTEYPYHAEWYFDCEEELILKELQRLKNAVNIRILHVE